MAMVVGAAISSFSGMGHKGTISKCLGKSSSKPNTRIIAITLKHMQYKK